MKSDDPIIDRSPKEKAYRVTVLREELKTLGYSVVRSDYLAALMFQAKRIKETEREKATQADSSQAGRHAKGKAEVS